MLFLTWHMSPSCLIGGRGVRGDEVFHQPPGTQDVLGGQASIGPGTDEMNRAGIGREFLADGRQIHQGANENALGSG